MGETCGPCLRFLVFGGCGFLGHHLISTLLEEYPRCVISVMDRGRRAHPPCCFEGDSRVVYRLGVDILRPETYRDELDAGIECLFNLVGCISYWVKDRDNLFRVNVTGIERLFETAREAGVRTAVHVSSVAAIGYSRRDPRPADESLAVPWSRFRGKHYMFTKHLGEEAALRFATDEFRVIVVNPCALYGPGDIQDLLHLFRSLAAGEVPAIPPGGVGVVDVRDAARGLSAAYRQGRAGQRYILVGENPSFANIFRLASQALGVTPPAVRLPRLLAAARPIVRGLELMSRKKPRLTADEFSFGFVRRFYTAEKARRELGWSPRFRLSQSIQDMADWYRSQDLLPGGAAGGTGRPDRA